MSRRRKLPSSDSSAPPAAVVPFPLKRAAVLVVGLVAVVYANALRNPLVYDDVLTVVENDSIRNLSNLEYVFRGALFRPIGNLSYAIDRHFWGLNPIGFHLTSIFLHAANAVLLLLLTRALVPHLTSWLTVVPAALFAVHPALQEAVGYVSARSEPLSTFFALLSLMSFLRAAQSNRVLWLMAAWATLLLGLASKEIAAAVPPLALLIDLLLLNPGGRGERFRRLYLAPLVLLALGAMARLFVYFRHEEAAAGSHFEQNLLLQVENVWRYLGWLVLPTGLSIVHEFEEVQSPTEPLFLLSAMGVIVAAVLAWRLRRQAPVTTLGIAWFLLALAPSAVVPLNEGLSEHRSYFASIGVFLIAGELVARLSLFVAPRLLFGTLAGIVLLLGAATWQRNAIWSDPVRLWTDAVEKAPRIYASHYALGDAYRLRGDCASALPEYRAAVERAPQRADGWNNLGICAAQTGALDEAGQAMQKAVALQPNNPSMHYNLGILARTRGDLALARTQFEATLRLAPAHANARQALDALK